MIVVVVGWDWLLQHKTTGYQSAKRIPNFALFVERTLFE